ncbi:NAD(P)-binding domain-containing protein [Exiguobacterium sp. s102]|uniref:NAD(P)-binding domain-containing protein n=1 Tax=Exiguobacterium sp. s102 TaxID=2751212 RepID=UPI001BE68C8D|nr:NAD(P)-binding domain-containing protein [Exiguobacterium sp. s102]
MSNQSFTHPIFIIGAGPIGLVAAAHLSQKGLPFSIMEAGAHIGTHIKKWSHVKMFSNWEYNIDPVAAAQLNENGWNRPAADVFPTGHDLLEYYLRPLATLPTIASNLYLQHQVVSISRQGIDKMTTADREQSPFEIIVQTPMGRRRFLAAAILDATGVWGQPNSMYSAGHPHDSLIERVMHTIPNFRQETDRYANQRLAIIGSGHSALTALMGAVALKKDYPETDIHWIIRKTDVVKAFGGEENDQLAERGQLGSMARTLVESGLVTVHTSFKVAETAPTNEGISLISADNRQLTVQEVIVLTGSRPDFSFLREIRMDVDSITESPRLLAPLIDPNLHSCGTVRPHGEAELRQPEKNFYIIGSKSYGRAPTFLLMTGYEQVRSIIAHLTGDVLNAKNIQLKLPETGVCKVSLPDISPSCC